MGFIILNSSLFSIFIILGTIFGISVPNLTPSIGAGIDAISSVIIAFFCTIIMFIKSKCTKTETVYAIVFPFGIGIFLGIGAVLGKLVFNSNVLTGLGVTAIIIGAIITCIYILSSSIFFIHFLPIVIMTKPFFTMTSRKELKKFYSWYEELYNRISTAGIFYEFEFIDEEFEDYEKICDFSFSLAGTGYDEEMKEIGRSSIKINLGKLGWLSFLPGLFDGVKGIYVDFKEKEVSPFFEKLDLDRKDK
jgi:hypothetical protein